MVSEAGRRTEVCPASQENTCTLQHAGAAEHGPSRQGVQGHRSVVQPLSLTHPDIRDMCMHAHVCVEVNAVRGSVASIWG